MPEFRYLSAAHLQGFTKYKYSCVDTSPLSNYVMHPFWNAVVQLVPRSVAPNVLTLTGWLLLMSNLALLSWYDWDYETSSSDLPSVKDRPPIPQWVWLYCAIAHFIGYTLDGIDGKQARRTNSSSPLGELFDHGLDSLAAILLPLCLYSALGRGHEWGGNPHGFIVPCIAVLAGFYLFHWEKYITGVLYLPWLFDATQLACSVAYLVTFIYGVELWHFSIAAGVSCGHALKFVLTGGFLTSIPMSLWNIWLHYRKTESSEESTNSSSQASPPPHPRRLSFLQAMSPWLPFVLMTLLYLAWSKLSPTDIVYREPRLFALTLGVVSSNIACRLIIAQMSSQSAELFNVLLIPLGVALALSLFQPMYELVVLYVYTVVVVLAHVHYGVGVVEELCELFRIHCFSLAKKEPTS